MSSMDKLELTKKILSPTINLLGNILGEVIIEQAGEEYFELEEHIRKLSKQFREQDDIVALDKLEEIINSLADTQRSVIIKAFSIFFQLVNLAEEDYKIHLTQDYTNEKELQDTILSALKYAKSMGINRDSLLTLLDQLKFKLVWTAHPTEARRLTKLIKLREIYQIIEKMEQEVEGSIDYKIFREKLKVLVTLMWQTDDLREEKVDILDEVRTNLFYFDKTIFDVLPKIIQEINLSINEIFPSQEKIDVIPIFLEFGSWVGGDRDGHPGVTSNVTIQTLLLHKRLCLRKYIEDTSFLIQELSSSTNQITVSDKLKDSIAMDAINFSDFTERTKQLNKFELYRKKLDYIQLKLRNTLEHVEKTAVNFGMGRTLVGSSHSGLNMKLEKENYYFRSNDFLEDLQFIDISLRENKGGIIANGYLSTLINKVRIFGFHLAPLDLRQHTRVHHQAISEIFESIGIGFQVNRQEKIDLVLRELLNPRPLGVENILKSLGSETRELLTTLKIILESLNHISPRAIQSYIISMTQDELDVYILLLMFKEMNLIEVKNNTICKACLDVVPLFETKEDLENAPNVLRRMLNQSLYRSMIEQRGNIQEIMIGYSDSTKDVGYLQSNYRLITAQQEFVNVANEFGIKLRIFHGRGGSISRGGGPTHKSILAQPPGTLFNMKITEQGEVIGANYSNPKIAHRHLEQIISAMIRRSVRDTVLEPKNNPSFPNQSYLKEFEDIAELARVRYEDMVKNNSNFIKFYLEFTPLDIIERATIGSRPSRRSTGDVSDISALRAIPWIFSWMQTRLIFTTYYGVGTAFTQYMESNGIEPLQELYKNWPYFTTLVDNLQMLLLKVDLPIASKYLNLVEYDSLKEIFDDIKGEYLKTCNAVMQIANISSILENSPDIQLSILRRNPYIDALSLIQVNLLAQWRELGRPESLGPSSLQRALLQTINGIAAGLRNTG
ncbi:MAG: phosphoenolpyruvate carboxylase [Candidatus Heimdallarchaeota archaeon]|nr:phosphoenolpyruvate carboxylase [Candidatus Heimdallarchaeota archaeon]